MLGAARKGRGKRRRDWSLLLFLLPALAIYVVFLVVPAVAALAMSVTS